MAHGWLRAPESSANLVNAAAAWPLPIRYLVFSARMKSSKLDQFDQVFDVKYFLGGTVLHLASAWFVAWLGGVIGSNVMLAIGVIMGAGLIMFGWWVWLGIFAILLIARIPPPKRRDNAN